MTVSVRHPEPGTGVYVVMLDGRVIGTVTKHVRANPSLTALTPNYWTAAPTGEPPLSGTRRTRQIAVDRLVRHARIEAESARMAAELGVPGPPPS